MKALQIVLIWSFALASEPSELERSLKSTNRKIPPPPPPPVDSNTISTDPNKPQETSYETLYARK